MSMNFFLKAFDADQMDAMTENHELIDRWVLHDKRFLDSLDIETAWDVLRTALKGDGFVHDTEVDEALFNGCLMVSPALAKTQARILASWSDEALAEALDDLDPGSDLYHVEVWLDEDGRDDLVDHFTRLRDFYAKAAEHDWGLVLYLA